LISNFSRVLNVVFFLLLESLASTFYVPTFRNTLFHLHRCCKQEESCTTYEDETECSETSAHKIQTPGIHPKERKQHYAIPVYTTVFLKMDRLVRNVYKT